MWIGCLCYHNKNCNITSLLWVTMRICVAIHIQIFRGYSLTAQIRGQSMAKASFFWCRKNDKLWHMNMVIHVCTTTRTWGLIGSLVRWYLNCLWPVIILIVCEISGLHRFCYFERLFIFIVSKKWLYIFGFGAISNAPVPASIALFYLYVA